MHSDHKCDIHTTCTLILYLPGGNLYRSSLLPLLSTNKNFDSAMPFTKSSTEINPQRATKILEIGKIASFSFKIKFFVVAVGTEISLFYHLHRKSKLKFS